MDWNPLYTNPLLIVLTVWVLALIACFCGKIVKFANYHRR